MLHNWAHTYLLNKQSEGDADAVQYMFDMDDWQGNTQYCRGRSQLIASLSSGSSASTYIQKGKQGGGKRRKTAVTIMWRTNGREQLKAPGSVFTKTLPPQGIHIEEERNRLFLLVMASFWRSIWSENTVKGHLENTICL